MARRVLDCPVMWQIAGGILLALVALRLVASSIDWLDARTSRITDAEARRRARLTFEGRWPPTRTVAAATSAALWTWLVIALLWAGWAHLRTWR
jgi:hypothetical protein